MSKKGRARRTPEQRIAAQVSRDNVKYLQRIQRQAAIEKVVKEMKDKAAVSETAQ
jgi:hypothetical protein